MHFDVSVLLCDFSITEYHEFASIVYHKNRCMPEMHGYCTWMIIITAQRSYASWVMGVVILSVRPSVRPSVTRVFCD